MTEKRYTITIGLNKEFKEIIDHCRQDKHISVFEFLKQVGEQDKAFKKLKQENKELKKENEQLKQFPVKLENRIQKLQEDLQKLTEMDKSDLNPQAIEDVATVIGISLNALIEFQKELEE